MRRAGVAAFGLGVLLTAGPASGQQIEKPKVQVFNDFRELAQGRKPTYARGSGQITDEAKAAIDEVAKWMVQRLADPAVYAEIDGVRKPTDKSMSAEYADTVRYMPRPLEPVRAGLIGGGGAADIAAERERAARADFIREFGRAIDGHIKEALNHQKAIVRVNAARLLAEVAKTGHYEIADTCAALLADDKTPDAVKYYAARALANLFSMPSLDEPANKARGVFPRKEAGREAKAIDALGKFVLRKVEVTPETPPQEVDGYRFVRREAVRALGLCRKGVARDGAKVVARPASVLLKVALKDGLTPPPSPDEQVEALIGFCQLPPDPSYNTDAAAYGLGAAAREVGKALAEAPAGASPWKWGGARLVAALEDFKAAVAGASPPFDKPRADLLKEIADRVTADLAAPLRTAGGKAQFDNLGQLDAWLRDHTPANPALFIDAADSSVVPAPAGGT